jgi:hypothetical protein
MTSSHLYIVEGDVRYDLLVGTALLKAMGCMLQFMPEGHGADTMHYRPFSQAEHAAGTPQDQWCWVPLSISTAPRLDGAVAEMVLRGLGHIRGAVVEFGVAAVSEVCPEIVVSVGEISGAHPDGQQAESSAPAQPRAQLRNRRPGVEQQAESSAQAQARARTQISGAHPEGQQAESSAQAQARAQARDPRLGYDPTAWHILIPHPEEEALAVPLQYGPPEDYWGAAEEAPVHGGQEAAGLEGADGSGGDPESSSSSESAQGDGGDGGAGEPGQDPEPEWHDPEPPEGEVDMEVEFGFILHGDEGQEDDYDLDDDGHDIYAHDEQNYPLRYVMEHYPGQPRLYRYGFCRNWLDTTEQSYYSSLLVGVIRDRGGSAPSACPHTARVSTSAAGDGAPSDQVDAQ